MATGTTPSINLLAQRRRKLARERGVSRKVFAGSALALLIYMVVLVPVVGYRFFLSAQLNSLERKVAEQEELVAEKVALETKHILVTEKLKLLDGFFEKRAKVREALDAIYSLFPSDIQLSGVSLGEVKEKIIVSGVSVNVFSFVELMAVLDEAAASEEYYRIVMDSVGRDGFGVYDFKIEFYPRVLTSG